MWANQYIGIPFKSGGRDRDGIDCWGLARLIYQEQYSINLPSFSAEYTEGDTDRMTELLAQYREGWENTTTPKEGDLVLIRVNGAETHIGVALDSERFIHVKKGTDTCIERFNSIAYSKRIVGYFRYSPKTGALVNAVPHPLKTERVTLPIPAGTTVSKLVELISTEYAVSDALKPHIVVMVNGIPIEKEYWDTCLLKSSDAVDYRVVAGDEDIFRMAAFIALVIIAPEIAATAEFYAMPYVGSTFASAAVYTAAYAGTMIIGSALINAIAPIRPPDPGMDPGNTESLLIADGVQNQARPYEAIPVVLGKVRLTPPLGAINYGEFLSERDQYLNVLLTWGYGPLIIDANTLKIGDQLWSTYTDKQIITFDRITEPTEAEKTAFNNLYGNDFEQKPINIALTAVGNDEANQPAPATETTPDNPIITTFDSAGYARASITLTFPEGLRYISKTDGGSGPLSVSFKISLSHDGGTTWFSTQTVTVAPGAPKKDAFSKTFELLDANGQPYTSQTAILTVKVERTTSSTKDNSSAVYSYSSILYSVQKSINTLPTVDPVGVKIAKSAIRIKATNQLAGRLDGISAVVQTYARIWNGFNWNTYAGTSNPAALFLYVITHPGNVQRVEAADEASRIDFAQLQYWYNYCETKGFKFNTVVGNQKSILNVLRDICSAGRASPAIVNGKWTVTIDEPKATIAQHFSPHNSWGFEASKALPKMPDGVKVQFLDEANDYQQNEITVYNSGKTFETSTIFEAINLPGITSSTLAIDHAKWHLSQAKARPEVYTLNTDVEYIVCTRGDRVKVMHDVPMWGSGSGRIKNRISNKVFDLDEPVSIENTATDYILRVRGKTNTTTVSSLVKSWTILNYKKLSGIVTITLNTSQHPVQVGDILTVQTNNANISQNFATVTAVTATTISYTKSGTDIAQTNAVSSTVSLNAGTYSRVELATTTTATEVDAWDLFLFGQNAKESQDLIVLNIEPTSSKTARLTLVDYGVTSTYNLFTDYTSIISTTQITYTKYSITNNVVLLQTSAVHSVKVGDKISVLDRATASGTSNLLTATNVAVTAVTSNTISYTKTGLTNTSGLVDVSTYPGKLVLVGGFVYESLITPLPYSYRDTLTTQKPTISSIVSDESALDVISPGVFSVNMMVKFAPTSSSRELPPSVQFIEVEYDYNSSVIPEGSKFNTCLLADSFIKLPSVDENAVYKVRARYKTNDGRYGPWTDYTTHTVIGKTTPPAQVSAFTAITNQSNGVTKMDWSSNSEKDLELYEIRTSDTGWGNNSYYWRGNTTALSATVAAGTTFYIRARDYSGNYSTTSRQAAVTITKPNTVSGLNYYYSNTSNTTSTVTLSWNAAVVPTNGFTVKHYKVEVQKPNGSTVGTITTDSTSINLAADWLADWSPRVAYKINDLVRYNNTIYKCIAAHTSKAVYEDGFNANSSSWQAQAGTPTGWNGGDAFVKITTVDVIGGESVSTANINISKYKPLAVIDPKADTIDNNVLMYWTLPSVTSLPISHVKVTKGTTYASSKEIGNKSGAFTTLFESEAGTYTYWLVTVDTDNRESEPVSITRKITQPPDYVLNDQFSSVFAGTDVTKVNCVSATTSQGTSQLTMLVNTTETWTQHFTNNSKTNIQGFIDAGYTYWVTPAQSVSSATYTEIFDTGKELGASSIKAIASINILSGSPLVVVTLSTSLDKTTWTTPIADTEIYATSFRYIKVTITATEQSATLQDLVQINSLSVKVDSKLLNDAGNVQAYAADTYGTIANFSETQVFSEVTSINISTQSTQAVVAVYDYKGPLTGTYTISGTTVTANITDHGMITGQKVKVVFSGGSGVNGVYTITKINDNSYTFTNTVSGSTGGGISTVPQSLRVYVYNTSGQRVDSPQVSWSIKGY